MKAQTYFNAYNRALRERLFARNRYGCNRDGIAVSKSPAAKRWQRYDRLVDKLHHHLTQILIEYDELTTS